jgi:ketosteroid isomerase-like protein
MIDAWNRGDPEASLAYFDEAIVYHPRDDEPEASPHIGREAFMGLVGGFLEAFSEITFELSELIDRGDDVIAVTRLHGRGAASGVEVSEPYVFLYHLRDGLIVEGREFRTTEEAFSALADRGSR